MRARDQKVRARKTSRWSERVPALVAMPVEPGTTVGPYAVSAKIGKGGMGEVYRARDTKLERRAQVTKMTA